MSRTLRSITVEGVIYRWRFDEKLVIIPGHRSSPQLYVDWGWQDWLEPGGAGGPEPAIVTPKFVAAAIRFALKHGYTPETNGPPMWLSYSEGSFSLVTDSETKNDDGSI